MHENTVSVFFLKTNSIQTSFEFTEKINNVVLNGKELFLLDKKGFLNIVNIDDDRKFEINSDKVDIRSENEMPEEPKPIQNEVTL